MKFIYFIIPLFILAFSQAFAEEEMIWESNTPLPTPRAYPGYASFDEKIYVIGGFDNAERALDVVEVFDTQTNSWSTLSPLPEPLHHTAAAAYEGKIYVVGGTQDQQFSLFGLHFRETVQGESMFFIYDINKHEWKRGPDMPTPRMALTAQVIDGILYVIGGANHYPYPIWGAEHEWYSVNEAYDISKNTWQAKAPMPTPRDHLQSAVLDNKIYVISGRQTSLESTLNSNEVYDPISDSWTSLEPMPTLRSGVSLAILNGTIFAFGGLAKEGGAVDVIEQYIPNQGWVTRKPLPIPLDGLTSVTVGNKIYVIGGISNQIVQPINVSYYDPNVIPEFNSAVPIAYGIEEMIWESNMPLPTLRAEFAFTTYDDKIYLIGGFDKTESALDVVEVYDTKTNSWSTLSPLPEPIHHNTAAAYDGKLYVAGGTQDQIPSYFGLHLREKTRAQSFFFIYDIEKDKWERGPDMPTPRLGLTSQAINGSVYVLGGANHFPYPIVGADHEWYAVNEAYDIESGVWQKKAAMPTPRDHLQSTVIDGKIYVVGGRQTSLKTTVGANEVYDHTTDKWEVLEPLPTPRAGLGVTNSNGTVFVFGGVAQENLNLDTVEQYIPNQGWVSHPPLPVALQGMATLSVAEKIYVMGGLGDHGLNPINVSYYDPNVIPEFSSSVFLVFFLSIILVIYLKFVPKAKNLLYP